MKRTFFGTDGIRGVYGGPVINESFAARLGFAAGKWAGGAGEVLIGRDTRASGERLAEAIASGLAAAGLRPVLLGVLPTPAVAQAVRNEGASLGVVITASHNPADDNGIKFFNARGLKLTDADEVAIEQSLPQPGDEPHALLVMPKGRTTVRQGVPGYLTMIAGLLPPRALDGWQIVLDTAHGATCATSTVALRRLGATVISIGDSPNGRNINDGVGSEHPEALSARVVESGAMIGIAHDGDGDRCVLCDERGGVLDGDEVLTLLALHAQRQGRLVANTLVITVQSNLGVDAALAAVGARVSRTAVGDRYVIERMLAEGATLGGESSGHIVCFEASPTGDGLVAALKVLEVMIFARQPLSVLRQSLKKFPQAQKALRVAVKRELKSCEAIQAEIATLEGELGSLGRVLVRFSGTEAKLRLLVEGPTDRIVQEAIARLEAATRRDLDVV